MNASGDSIDDLSACEGNGTATASARALFRDHERQRNLQPEFLARSMPALRALGRAREHCDVVFRTTDGAEIWTHRFVLSARYAGCGAFFSGSEERTGFRFQRAPQHENVVRPPFSKAVVSDLSSEMLELLIDLAYRVPIHDRVGLHNVREVHLARLLPQITFAFCSRANMAKVERYPLVCASEQALEVSFVVKRMLGQESRSDVYWRTRPDLSKRRWLNPRVPKDVLFTFGGGTNHLLTYNCRSSRSLLKPHQKTHPRAYHGVAMPGGLKSL
ncbi:hypothetical protein HPB48_016968 [Haemaphysalis longicornis]|uniref:BTB domain-containing protein n=1 Tax=Haemaphysalis longicornis TaxID=44386 RepID=A0A9J6H3Y4_HAELO|nr:hypothetical protein HPB48_016968 [Haemaphysalis longicornis]